MCSVLCCGSPLTWGEWFASHDVSISPGQTGFVNCHGLVWSVTIFLGGKDKGSDASELAFTGIGNLASPLMDTVFQNVKKSFLLSKLNCVLGISPCSKQKRYVHQNFYT